MKIQSSEIESSRNLRCCGGVPQSAGHGNSCIDSEGADSVRRTRSHDLPKPDSRGRIRACVGFEANGTKARFEVGNRQTSIIEASQRLGTIRSLYEKQCERFERNHWVEWTKRVARKIGAGQPIVDTCISDADAPSHLAGVVDQLRSWGIHTNVTRPDAYQRGAQRNSEQITTIVQKIVADEIARQRAVRGPVADHATLPADPLALAEARSFYQAVDDYADHLKEVGKRDQSGNLVTRVGKCCDRLRYLKEHHSDLPLWKLNLPKLETTASYWRNRPATQKSDRCSKHHATDMLKELWRFLRWLDKHPDYHWQMPRGASEIKRSPVSLPEDDDGEAFQTITKETYTVDQLAQILRCTDEFGRVLISVCVNCAFGASEIGQWLTSKFALRTAHPHANRLEIPASDADSWITGRRPKTNVYGEHLLWPQVGDAVAPFLDGRSVLPLTVVETPWYRTHSRNPQSKFTKWWNDLIELVQQTDEAFPHLPFGSLRDVLPDILRSRYSDDVASLALQHGEIGDDNLLKHYANKPYRRLFDATRELEAHFQPMLAELATKTEK